MNIIIRTSIPKNYQQVFSMFDISLFKALRPPFISLEVERFDGCQKGNEIHLKIGLGPITQSWVSIITSDYKNDLENVFIDEGKVLPKPLNYWKHTHKVIKKGENSCEIHDDIEYRTGNLFLDFVIYPVMFLQFYLRKSIYKKYFKGHKNAP